MRVDWSHRVKFDLPEVNSDDESKPIKLDDLLSRLTRPNTTTANKLAPWTAPRLDYERGLQLTTRTYFPNPARLNKKFGKLDKQYGTKKEGQKLDELTKSVSAPTHTHIKRSYDIIKRRLDVEDMKKAETEARTRTASPTRTAAPRHRSGSTTSHGRVKSKSAGTSKSNSSPYLSLPTVHHHHHHHHRKGSASTHSSRDSHPHKAPKREGHGKGKKC